MSIGGRIILGCRDMEKCEAAAKEIRGSTLNRHVYASQLDLSSLKSIREFAEKIKKGCDLKRHLQRPLIEIKHTQLRVCYCFPEEQHVDVLINNAGVMRCPAWKTEDGFDMQFGVNHLGNATETHIYIIYTFLKKTLSSYLRMPVFLQATSCWQISC